MIKEVKKEPIQTGENRNKEGKFIKGKSGNPNGRPKGTLSLVSLLKEELQRITPESANKKEKETYALALIRKTIKIALISEDTQMIKDIFNRVDGMPKQNLELGLDDIIGEVKLTLVKNENSKPANNDSVPKKPGAVPEKRKENPDKRGGDGKLKDSVPGATDGNDNAERKGEADNDSKKVPASPEGNSDEGLPERAEGTGSV